MQILIVAATKAEIEPFIAKNQSADVLIAGVGIAATVYHLTKRIHQLDYDLVIQAGICGGFDKDLPLGKLLNVVTDRFADVGLKSGNQFSSVYEMGLSDADEFPFINGWLQNNAGVNYLQHLPAVKGITVNTVTDDHDYIDHLTKKYNASVESMEGAALHYVCLNEDVPFIQLRAVSNYVGERDKSRWDIANAVLKLNEQLDEFYTSLNPHVSE